MIKMENVTGNIIRITVPETLHADDFLQLAPQMDEIIRQQGKIQLLVDARQFDGWANTKAFEKHIRFVKDRQQSIERGAIIAGHRWHHWVAGILRLFIQPEIRVFDKDEADEAMQWITGGRAAA